MQHITEEQLNATFDRDDIALSERINMVVDQRYYVEAVAINDNDDKNHCIVHLHKFNEGVFVYNLCDFTEQYSFVDAIIFDVTDDVSYRVASDAVRYLIDKHVTDFDLKVRGL